jgi:HEAT repeat protein
VTNRPVSRSELAALIDDPVPYLGHSSTDVRRLAVSAMHGHVDEAASVIAGLLATDPDPSVRAQAAETIAEMGSAAIPILDLARDDDDERVVEAVATAYGEIADPSPVDWLIDQASHSGSRRVAEAAVASLGAIGDDRARPVLIALVAAGPPQVRRRAVVALTVFDGADVEAAIRSATADRNPMVREAAEMVTGRPAG